MTSFDAWWEKTGCALVFTKDEAAQHNHRLIAMHAWSAALDYVIDVLSTGDQAPVKNPDTDFRVDLGSPT